MPDTCAFSNKKKCLTITSNAGNIQNMKLKEYLEINGISQDEFGEKIGKSQQSVSDYCNDIAPSRDVALKIVAVTKGKVTLEDLWDVKLAGSIPK